jgi:hypothetical protein
VLRWYRRQKSRTEFKPTRNTQFVPHLPKGKRSSTALMISSARHASFAIARIVGGTLFPPPKCASSRAGRNACGNDADPNAESIRSTLTAERFPKLSPSSGIVRCSEPPDRSIADNTIQAELQVSESANAEMIYLISSAFRTSYVRDILAATCLPKNYILPFRYLPTWVDSQFLNPSQIRDRLHGRQGVIVYADIGKAPAPAEQLTFYPVRMVTIVEPSFDGPVLYIPMVLGDFVDYGGSKSARQKIWDDEIKKIALAPGNGNKFIFEGSGDPQRFRLEEPANFEGWSGAERGWQSVVEQLVATDRFRFSTFFHINRLFVGENKEIQPQRKGAYSLYKLLADKTFGIEITFYQRTGEYLEGRKVSVVANQDLFSGDVGRSIFADYQYNRVRIHLLTKRRFESDLSTISIRAQEWTPSPAAVDEMVKRRIKELLKAASSAEEVAVQAKAREEIGILLASKEFFSPVPELLVRIRAPWLLMIGSALLFVIGTVLLSLPPDVTSAIVERTAQAFATQANGAAWSPFLRTAGGVFAFLGILIVFRKWPLK